MILKKTTILLGKNPLSDLDIAYELKSKDKLEELLFEALDAKDFDARYDRFLKHVSYLLEYGLFPYNKNKNKCSILEDKDCIDFNLKSFDLIK